MDIILIPGLWLDADSWSDVARLLERSGHAVHALTMPGVGENASASADVGIGSWIDAAVAVVDAVETNVVVVGHSGGGNVAWGTADARPDSVSRVILVDTVPPPSGFGISEFEIVDGVIPFPGWEFFPTSETADLDEQTRRRTAMRSLSVPARVPTDPIRLSDPARFRVPVTLLMGSHDSDSLMVELEQWGPFAEEYRSIDHTDVVTLGSGHWPQFSVPERLAAEIDAAARRT